MILDFRLGNERTVSLLVFDSFLYLSIVVGTSSLYFCCGDLFLNVSEGVS